MKRMDEREQIRNLIDYHRRRGRKRKDSGGHEAAFREITLLDEEQATVVDIEKILGRTSFIAPLPCNECGCETWDIVQLGEEPTSPESRTARLCGLCLLKGARLAGIDFHVIEQETS